MRVFKKIKVEFVVILAKTIGILNRNWSTQTHPNFLSFVSLFWQHGICLHFQSVDIHFFTLNSTFTAIKGSVTPEHLSHGHEENFTFYDFVVFFIVFDHATRAQACIRWSKYATILLISHYCCYPSIKPGLKGNRSCYTSA